MEVGAPGLGEDALVGFRVLFSGTVGKKLALLERNARGSAF